ncbi:Alpha/Beta hydrolase protein [Mariannaea sp. PMI_226]|nr:Alpha/Beta hydrolase protein [Mariannaea sp. PMI_226]
MAASTPSTPKPHAYVPLYDTLPPTPNLPKAAFSGTARINNINLWYALFGSSLQSRQTPVVFLHGGKISSRWWSLQIRHLADNGYPVIAIDTRAHGRSSDDPDVPLSYDLFANDTVALLAHLKVPKASFVGWSDGANTALSLAMHHADLVDRAFVFGANYQPDQVNITGLLGMPFLSDLQGRMQSEYEALSPTPKGFAAFLDKMNTMQAAFPDWDDASFAKIDTLFHNPQRAPIMWIADGDSEEVVQRRVAGEIRDMIWGSSLVIMPGVGHFSPLEDPDTFNALLSRWLSVARQ